MHAYKTSQIGRMRPFNHRYWRTNKKDDGCFNSKALIITELFNADKYKLRANYASKVQINNLNPLFYF